MRSLLAAALLWCGGAFAEPESPLPPQTPKIDLFVVYTCNGGAEVVISNRGEPTHDGVIVVEKERKPMLRQIVAVAMGPLKFYPTTQHTIVDYCPEETST